MNGVLFIIHFQGDTGIGLKGDTGAKGDQGEKGATGYSAFEF